MMALFAITCLPVQNLYAGEKDGGGGNVIVFKGQAEPFLLDRLLLSPELATTSNSTRAINLSAREYAEQRLNLWLEQVSGLNLGSTQELIKLIQQSLNRMAIIEVPYKFKTISRYYLPSEILNLKPKIITAILYMDGYGAFVSSPIWNQLSIETQAGLLIHESIRQIQFRYGFHDLTDAKLQYLTAFIMDRSPESSGALDNYMSSQLLRLCYVRSVAQRAGPNQLIAKIAIQNEFHLQDTLDQNQNNNQRNALDGKTVEDLLKDKIDRSKD